MEWFGESNRWKHLLGGFIIGLFADGWYCAIYTGFCVGAALELKDKLYGNEFDYVDCLITLVGSAVGQLCHQLLIKSICQ